MQKILRTRYPSEPPWWLRESLGRSRSGVPAVNTLETSTVFT